ncbi:MMPL family transporter [Aciduricibacillus chroicocephali]|uniref:MMPL family transporter n=1 Tax=Aciduricibacillus chroicocephali TaxID=3054939 RepID=A0ABY9KW14_9BACI|nr:MMPL family transporter [Bacillaceae bacterium 44XB]
MRQVIRFRWFFAVLWIALAAGLFLLAPNLQDLVRDKGNIQVPEEYNSQQADKLLEKISGDKSEDTASAVLVFNDKNKLGNGEKKDIKRIIDKLEKNKDKLGVSDILDYTKDQQIADQTVSKDGKTVLVPFNVSLKNQDIGETREKIENEVKDAKVDHYLTGQQYIEQDIILNSEEGLKKTELITVGLILVILFIVFRSFVAPFIPLLTVGVSYLAAQSVVAILANTVNFPLSTFTQIFMVAVMFGIGTDYCILIINRFKEELGKHDNAKEAVLTTYRSTGKTFMFAGLAVLIGFSAIGLSTFSLYQSAVAVAVGVAVMLLAILTLVPFFLATLGSKLFWPFHKNVAHKESGIWGTMGKYAWKRPMVAILIVAVITIPFLLTYSGSKSYNSLDEIGNSYPSVKGFNLIADSFGAGQIMPMTVVLQTKDHKVSSTKDYQDIDQITNELSKIKGVHSVRSATRPAGKIIDDFRLKNQAKKLAEGLDKSGEGLNKIQQGLGNASGQLQQAGPSQEQRVQMEQMQQAQAAQQASGTQGGQAAQMQQAQMQQAQTQMEQLGQLQKGLGESANGLGEIGKGLDQTQAYLEEISKNADPSYVYIPEDAIKDKGFKQGTEMYLSNDKKITKFEVILDYNPYSKSAMNLVGKVKDRVDTTKKGTVFADSKTKIGGVSSMNHDLQQISDEDYSRTAVLMIAGIFIILVILLKSLVMPLYLIGSLLLTYFTSMAIGEVIFTDIMDYSGMTWAIPFFAFVMLVALGIDYSIFLMGRFNETRTGDIMNTFLQSMKDMGTVVISAAVILGGTFAAMLPSGVLSLLQIATVVITGLFLYALIILPLFIPVMVRLFGPFNWWPFKRESGKKQTE